MNPNFNPAFNLHPLTTPVLAPGFHGFQPNPPAQAGLDPANPAPPVLTARQQYAINHQQVLATVYGRRFLWASISMVITSVVLVLFSSVAPWFHVEGKQTTYYCKDSFLWVFLIPPLTCLPLLLASTPRVRLCWWHCWTVTVISLVVPAAVVFVSFGASLVYTGSGAVLWGVGAFFIMISYITCILAGLLYMKLAHIIEVGPPHGAAQAEPLPGPITVCIHADPSDKYDFDDNGFRLSPSLPGPAMN